MKKTFFRSFRKMLMNCSLITAHIMVMPFNGIQAQELDSSWQRETVTFQSYATLQMGIKNVNGVNQFITLSVDDSTYYRLRETFSFKPPVLDDCIYFDPVKAFDIAVNDNIYTRRPVLPNSSRFYIDTSFISTAPGETYFSLNGRGKLPLEKYLSPFYFRKYEVTNAEYRKFIGFVKDSIARVILCKAGNTEYGRSVVSTDKNGKKVEKLVLDYKQPVDWKSSDLDALYYTPEENFYGRKTLNPLNWKYSFCSEGSDPVAINIYPDTLCWRNDFPFSFNDPISSCYFWHKDYGDYPVVGISWHQALAYLDWRTRQHQKELNAKGIRLKIKYDLPSEYEWDIVATTILKDGKQEYFSGEYSPYLTDHSWLTDLRLVQDTGTSLRMEKINTYPEIDLSGRKADQKDSAKNEKEADITSSIYQRSEKSNLRLQSISAVMNLKLA